MQFKHNTNPERSPICFIKARLFFLIAPKIKSMSGPCPAMPRDRGAVLTRWAQDTEAGVVRLEFTIDVMPYQEVTSAQPQEFIERAYYLGHAAEPRKYLITVEAFRDDGSSMDRDDRPVEVTVSPAKLPFQFRTPQPNTNIKRCKYQLIISRNRHFARCQLARQCEPQPDVRTGGQERTTRPLAQSIFGDQAAIIGRSSDAQWWPRQNGANTGWVLGT
jgi:hypothetical protein